MLPLARRPSEAAGRFWRPAHESLIDTPYNFEAPCAWQSRPRSMPRVWPSPRPARGFAAPGCAPSRMAADACCRHARPILSKKPRNVTCRAASGTFFCPNPFPRSQAASKTAGQKICACNSYLCAITFLGFFDRLDALSRIRGLEKRVIPRADGARSRVSGIIGQDGAFAFAFAAGRAPPSAARRRRPHVRSFAFAAGRAPSGAIAGALRAPGRPIPEIFRAKRAEIAEIPP